LKVCNISAQFSESLFVKNLSAQVDVIIHAYGILLALPLILDDDERIEYLSLGAGTGGKKYDLSTSKRVAEFKFAKWSKNRNAIRQNNIFTDYLELTIDKESPGKRKYIYCYSANAVKRFLSTSKRSLESVLSKNSINKRHTKYQQDFITIKGFYDAHKDKDVRVEIVCLEKILIGCQHCENANCYDIGEQSCLAQS